MLTLKNYGLFICNSNITAFYLETLKRGIIIIPNFKITQLFMRKCSYAEKYVQVKDIWEGQKGRGRDLWVWNELHKPQQDRELASLSRHHSASSSMPDSEKQTQKHCLLSDWMDLTLSSYIYSVLALGKQINHSVFLFSYCIHWTNPLGSVALGQVLGRDWWY